MSISRQEGMVLLISLILLLMLTLIAITASSQSTLQMRISSNSEQRNAAFQAAEAGIAIWTNAFLTGQTPPTTGTVGQAKFTVLESKYTPSCRGGSSIVQGSNVRSMLCVDLTVEGGAACDDRACAVTVIHRQGIQRPGDIQ